MAFSFSDHRILSLICLLSSVFLESESTTVARFVVHAITARSIVIRMVDSEGVSRFDMNVLIFDLDRQREFRRSELAGAKPQQSQLFSFDGLLPGNWFALRIEYRLQFESSSAIGITPSTTKDASIKNSSTPVAKRNDAANIHGKTEFDTKQEMVVRTRDVVLLSDDNDDVGDIIKQQTVLVVRELSWLDGDHQKNRYLNVTLSSALPAQKQHRHGLVNPPASKVPPLSAATSILFELYRKKHQRRHHTNPKNSLYSVKRAYNERLVSVGRCSELCLFPFVRVLIDGAENITTNTDRVFNEDEHMEKQKLSRHELFRGGEICEKVDLLHRRLLQQSEGKFYGGHYPGFATERHFRSSRDEQFSVQRNSSGKNYSLKILWSEINPTIIRTILLPNLFVLYSVSSIFCLTPIKFRL